MFFLVHQHNDYDCCRDTHGNPAHKSNDEIGCEEDS